MADSRTFTVKIEFQYKPRDEGRPFDFVQEEELTFEAAAGTPLPCIPIPAVGDTVVVGLSDHGRNAYKVLTRHFDYQEIDDRLYVLVNIVVTDVADHEMAARVKA